MDIPTQYFKNDTAYHSLYGDLHNSIIACGFMYKPDSTFSDTLCFRHYGAFYLLSGSGLYEDEFGRKIPLYAGDYVQRLPDVHHTTHVQSTGDWLEFFICFGAETYQHLSNLNLLSKQPVIHPGLSSMLFKKAVYILNCAKDYTNDKQATLYLNLQEFAIELYQRSLHKQMDPGTQRLMQKASDLLSAPPDFPSAHDVADELHMNYESFRKKFKEYYQQSPTAYQLVCRINYSKTLLFDTNKNLNEIALLCKFSDAFAYSKAFKKQYGISPSIFRQMFWS